MNGRRRFLYASVISIQDSPFLYPACQNCFSRLVQVFQSYNCHKCGSTTEVKNVHYRYKLSLRVADENELYKIAVFGSCLEEYFGITADELQRYIQDLTCDSEEHEREAAQNILLQAIEYCFVGKSFIFGVKSSESKAEQLLYSHNSLLKSNRHEKDLVACQILLPNVDGIGCTVFKFYNRLLQSSAFSSFHGTSQYIDCAITPVDQPSGDFSSLCRSRRNRIQSKEGRNNLLLPWQLSFGLASSGDYPITEESSLARLSNVVSNHSVECKTSTEIACTLQSTDQPIQDAKCVGSVTKRKSKGKKLVQQLHCEFSRGVKFTEPVPSSFVKIKTNLGNKFTLMRDGSSDQYVSSSLQGSATGQNSIFKTKVVCKSVSSSETSWSSCQDNELNFSSSSMKEFKSVVGDEDCQGVCSDEEHSVAWDDLPFSESLSEFIENIQKDKNSTAQIGCEALRMSPCVVHNDLRTTTANLLYTSKHLTVNSPTGHSTKSLPLEHAVTSRNNDHSSCHSLDSSVLGHVADSNDFSKYLETGSQLLENADLCVSSEESASPPNHNLDVKAYKGDVCENNELKLVPESDQMAHTFLLQDSNNHSFQNSYNGSGDLFDTSENELEIVLKSVHSQLYPSASPDSLLYTRCIVKNPCITMACTRSLHMDPPQKPNNFMPQKSCSSPISSQSDSDQENADSQHFVPSSQSTPVLQQFLRIGSFCGKRIVVTSPSNSKSEKSKLSLQGNFLRQPAGHFCKRKTSQILGNAKRITSPCVSLEDCGHFSPSADLFESDAEECIPPSGTKLLPKPKISIMPTGRKVINNKICKATDKRRSVQIKENSKQVSNKYSLYNEQEDTHEQPSVLVCSVEAANCTRAVNNTVSSLKPSACWTPTCSENTNCLSRSGDYHLFFSQVQVNASVGSWSPELFAEEMIVSQHRDLVQKQLF